MPIHPQEKLIEAFVRRLAVEKGYSPHTCRAYEHDLREFFADLSEAGTDGDGPDVTPRRIRGYLGRLHKKNAKRTIARKLSALRSFFEFLDEEERGGENPARGVQTPKLEKTLPGCLTVDDAFRLLDAIETDSLAGKRDRAKIGRASCRERV